MNDDFGGLQSAGQPEVAGQNLDHLQSPAFLGGSQHISGQGSMNRSGPKPSGRQAGAKVRQRLPLGRDCQVRRLPHDFRLGEPRGSHAVQGSLQIPVDKTQSAIADVAHRRRPRFPLESPLSERGSPIIPGRALISHRVAQRERRTLRMRRTQAAMPAFVCPPALTLIVSLQPCWGRQACPAVACPHVLAGPVQLA